MGLYCYVRIVFFAPQHYYMYQDIALGIWGESPMHCQIEQFTASIPRKAEKRLKKIGVIG